MGNKQLPFWVHEVFSLTPKYPVHPVYFNIRGYGGGLTTESGEEGTKVTEGIKNLEFGITVVREKNSHAYFGCSKRYPTFYLCIPCARPLVMVNRSTFMCIKSKQLFTDRNRT